MRKLFFICLFVNAFLISSSVAQTVDLTIETKSNQLPRFQPGKQDRKLRVPSTFTLETIAGNLGQISAITYDNETRYLIADQKRGQIWQLTDRNKDGQIDTKRALAHRFDHPSGLAVDGEKIFIADRNAVWVTHNLEPPEKLAGLRNANSTGARHRLSLSSDKTSLLLGLTTSDQITKILSIDVKTGQAELLNEISTQETFIDFGHRHQSPPWVILDNSFGPNLSSRIEINTSHTLYGGAVPNFTTMPQNIFNNHIYLSRRSSEGFDVLATPINLGRINGHSKKVLSGFLSQTKRSAWGAPGPLLFDRHGLIISDPFNGDLYRLRPKSGLTEENEKDKPTAEIIGAQKESITSTLTSKMKGSQIDQGSTIEKASGLTKGSNLSENYKSLALEVKDSKKE